MQCIVVWTGFKEVVFVSWPGQVLCRLSCVCFSVAMFDTIATSRENGSAVVVNLQNDGQWLPLNRQVAARATGCGVKFILCSAQFPYFSVAFLLDFTSCTSKQMFHKLRPTQQCRLDYRPGNATTKTFYVTQQLSVSFLGVMYTEYCYQSNHWSELSVVVRSYTPTLRAL